jgi:A/G-specific adenine glycosylase
MKTALLKWYYAEKRELPWRQSQNPYHIWLSEIILQQTRVDQGLNYYVKFINMFPDVFALAQAEEETVLKAWQGLGYYSRARNLHHTANTIVNQYNGIFPDDPMEVRKLKGIGEYTTAAILSIAYNKVLPVCDGNVERVVCRYLALQTPAKQTATHKRIMDFLWENISDKHPGDFNQAMMELGALVCKPAAPECHKCPISRNCKGRALDIAAQLPVKLTKAAIPQRYYYYLVIRNKKSGCYYLRKRTAQGVWKNLYDFPLIEREEKLNYKELSSSTEWTTLLGNTKVLDFKIPKPVIHKLSHRNLNIYFCILEIPANIKLPPDLLKLQPSELSDYPVPKPVADFLSEI